MVFLYRQATMTAIALPLLASWAQAGPLSLTNDFFARTTATTCGGLAQGTCFASSTGFTQTSFGDLQTGGFNTTGGFDSAESRFFHDSFGLFARGSSNSPDCCHQGSGYAEGDYSESILVPPQQGMLAGDPGTL